MADQNANDIINPKSDGIRFMSTVSRNNLISSNLIVNPGNFDYYENGNTTYSGVDAYIMLPDRNADVLAEANFLTRNFQDALISETDYSLLPGSPLADAAARTNPEVTFDFLSQPRPVGPVNDIGAMEGASGVDIRQSEMGMNAESPWISAGTDAASLVLHYHSDVLSADVLTVYDLNGTVILNLVQEDISGGDRRFVIPENRLRAGLFIFTLQTGQKKTGGRFFCVR